MNGFGGGYGSATGYGLGYGEVSRSGQIEQVLVINSASHNHTVDNIVLLQVHQLTVNNTTHLLSSDNIEFGAAVLYASDSTISHTAESPNITSAQMIVIANTSHGQVVDGNLMLWQNQVISIDNADHTLYTDPTFISQRQFLTIDNALHNLYSTKTRIDNWTGLSKDFGTYIPRYEDAGFYGVLELSLLEWDDDFIFTSEDNIPMRPEQDETNNTFIKTTISKGEF